MRWKNVNFCALVSILLLHLKNYLFCTIRRACYSNLHLQAWLRLFNQFFINRKAILIYGWNHACVTGEESLPFVQRCRKEIQLYFSYYRISRSGSRFFCIAKVTKAFNVLKNSKDSFDQERKRVDKQTTVHACERLSITTIRWLRLPLTSKNRNLLKAAESSWKQLKAAESSWKQLKLSVKPSGRIHLDVGHKLSDQKKTTARLTTDAKHLDIKIAKNWRWGLCKRESIQWK